MLDSGDAEDIKKWSGVALAARMGSFRGGEGVGEETGRRTSSRP